MAKSKKDDIDISDGFPNKWKKLISHWTDTADGFSEEDLNKTIIDSEKAVSDTDRDIENDERLNALKEELKEVSGAYKDTMKVLNAKIRYCVYLLNQRGNA
jgi:hypothetical protein